MPEEQNLWQEDQTSRDLRFYFAVARKPLLISLGVILFFYLLSLISFLDWSQKTLNYISWLIVLILISLVCSKVARVKFQELIHAATAGALVGLAVGIGHAFLQMIWFWSWWMVVNLIIEPLAIALGGLLVGILITKIFQIIHRHSALSPARDSHLDPIKRDFSGPVGGQKNKPAAESVIKEEADQSAEEE